MRNMREKKIFFDQLKMTSQACGDLQANDEMNPFEQNFQNYLTDLHDDPNFGDSSKLTMMGVQVLDLPTEKRNQMNLVYFRAEMGAHKNDRSSATNCFRQNLDWNTVFQVDESVEPGFSQKIIPKCMEQKVDTLKRSAIGGWLLYFLGKFNAMNANYLDFIRDAMLFYTLVTLISIQSLLNPDFFLEFSNVILCLLFISIMAPLVATAIKVGIHQNGIIFGQNVKIWIALPLAIIFCPALPALLTNLRDIEKEKTKALLKEGQDLPWTLEEAHRRILKRRKIEENIHFFKAWFQQALFIVLFN